jgi:DNA-binding NtrC family response regulator
MYERTDETAVLVVMPPDLQSAKLVEGLKLQGLKPLKANTCRAARHSLRIKPQTAVVITAATLPDGNWCDLLQYVVRSGRPTSVILYCPVADEALWLEAIGRGADDVLAAPFDPKEFQRSIERARYRRLKATQRRPKPLERAPHGKKAEPRLSLTPLSGTRRWQT